MLSKFSDIVLVLVGEHTKETAMKSSEELKVVTIHHKDNIGTCTLMKDEVENCYYLITERQEKGKCKSTTKLCGLKDWLKRWDFVS